LNSIRGASQPLEEVSRVGGFELKLPDLSGSYSAAAAMGAAALRDSWRHGLPSEPPGRGTTQQGCSREKVSFVLQLI